LAVCRTTPGSILSSPCRIPDLCMSSQVRSPLIESLPELVSYLRYANSCELYSVPTSYVVYEVQKEATIRTGREETYSPSDPQCVSRTTEKKTHAAPPNCSERL
jgi:hypothetical protein